VNDTINVTDENLDTILDCPDEEDYESKQKSTKIFPENPNIIQSESKPIKNLKKKKKSTKT
jgi:hypothetical protein